LVVVVERRCSFPRNSESRQLPTAQYDSDDGRRIRLAGIASVPPAEFVILRVDCGGRRYSWANTLITTPSGSRTKKRRKEDLRLSRSEADVTAAEVALLEPEHPRIERARGFEVA
jgi:hypothetical protein